MNETARRPQPATLSRFRIRGELPVPTLINGLTLTAVPLLLFFALRAARAGADPITAPLLLAFAVVLALNSLVYLLLGYPTLHRRTFITLITGLFVYLAVQAVEDGSAIIWLFAYPPVIFYISEARTGITACAGGLAGLILLFSPVGDLLFQPPHSASFRLSMVLALAFEMATCYVLDQSRRRSKLSLLRLAADLDHAAKHDSLTQLANRREALAQLDGEYQRFLRNRRPFSVLLIDIDLFKAINDRYGHHAGDQVIRQVARTLQQACRKVDTPARWGGEEYLVLLPETNAGEAWQTGQPCPGGHRGRDGRGGRSGAEGHCQHRRGNPP